jgi:hypothetical protein
MNGKRWKQTSSCGQIFHYPNLGFWYLSNITLLWRTLTNDNHIHMMSSCHNNFPNFLKQKHKKVKLLALEKKVNIQMSRLNEILGNLIWNYLLLGTPFNAIVRKVDAWSAFKLFLLTFSNWWSFDLFHVSICDCFTFKKKKR